MSAHWYALRSKPRKERILWQEALARGCETFYPRILVQPVNPRAQRHRSYFPGYLFVRADLNSVGTSMFEYMPYAIGLVCFGGEPAPIPEALIQAIQHKLHRIASAGGELFDGLNRGDPVWISDGPFAGYRGIFDVRLPGSERVRVLLEMLTDRFVSVEMSAGFIEKVGTRPAPVYH